MVLPMNEDLTYALNTAKTLRANNINTEVNYSKKSVKSMMNYANRIKVPYVIIIGEDEEKENKVTIKNMTTGEQNKITVEEVVEMLK